MLTSDPQPSLRIEKMDVLRFKTEGHEFVFGKLPYLRKPDLHQLITHMEVQQKALTEILQ